MPDKVLEVLDDGTVVLDRMHDRSTRPSPDALSLWTIYANPTDYPGKYVVRRSEVLPNMRSVQTGDLSVHDSLEAARNAVPRGRHNLGRQPEDHAQIAEVWI